MSKTVQPIIEALFTGTGRSQPVDFSWRMISRHGRPFLLLPEGFKPARTGLNLYSAQRKRAKILRKILPALFQTPFAGFFERVHCQADASVEIVQFMAQQADIPADRICPPAIMVSEVGSRARVVILLCDESGRPARVIKAGLNAAGRAATDAEADILAQLPPGKLGCIRLTGRISTPTLSAFATEYFPGTSPFDDAGLEHLFHDWLNEDEPVLLESLSVWRTLVAAVAEPQQEAWRQIQAALAGKKLCTTLYHGDFAPWNVRVVNSRNLQTFDWERGSRQGIPGWDWFHFTIQTAILARHHSAERAAAEVEQMFHSPRFQKYAAAAGISDQVQPLVLAYLLHHICVTKPLEGGETAAELFDLLCAHWLMKPLPAPVATPAPGLEAAVRRQLGYAARQWNNLFWEPSLSSAVRPSWRAEIQSHGPALLAFGLLVALIGTTQFFTTTHLTFLPFYVVACALLTWKSGRRLGALGATVTVALVPLLIAVKDEGFRDPDVMLWNTVMRFIILQICVLFVDRIHKQREMVHHRLAAGDPPVEFAANWLVPLACGLALVGVTALDYLTEPRMIFLPLYILPCMILTLVWNLRWGFIAALLAAGASSWTEYATNKLSHYTLTEVFVWNFPMRFAATVLVLLLLNRIRKENILFLHRKSNGG